MTHGVSIRLCSRHRAPGYLSHEGGSTFADALESRWRAHGIATRQRLGALRAHRRQCIPPRDAQPGSYAWPDLRREAEHRYAAGERPGEVIEDLRERHGDGPARAPSARTMRRWFHEGRWRHDQEPPGRRRRRRLPRVLPAGMSEEAAFSLLTPLIVEETTRGLSETAGLRRTGRPNRRE